MKCPECKNIIREIWHCTEISHYEKYVEIKIDCGKCRSFYSKKIPYISFEKVLKGNETTLPSEIGKEVKNEL